MVAHVIGNLITYIFVFAAGYLVYAGLTFPIVFLQFHYPHLFFHSKQYAAGIEEYKETFAIVSFSSKTLFWIRSFLFYGTSNFSRFYNTFAMNVNVFFCKRIMLRKDI